MTAKEILESYDEITIGEQLCEDRLFFTLYEKQFLFTAPSRDDLASKAEIHLYNDSFLDYPHVLLQETSITEGEVLPKGTYRKVCLFEQDSIVNSILSYDEKIYDCIDRLIELLNMSSVEKEREFQKEFLYYWNSETNYDNIFQVYLDQDNQVAEMDVFFNKSIVRLTDRRIELSDLEETVKGERRWVHHLEKNAFFIPIKDCRGILPPHRGYKWTAKDVQEIIYGKQIEHISDESFERIKTLIPKTQDVILVFGMRTETTNIAFTLNIRCKNRVGHSLLEKILTDITAVEPLFTKRKDYSFLSEQIGNDIGTKRKKVLLVGAGSLGSYVAFELVKNGFTHLKIYDDDTLAEENTLRWAYEGFGIGASKTQTLKIMLEWLHPQILIDSCNKKLDTESLTEELKDTDIIIFTIGNSDAQLKFNKVLKQQVFTKPVLYVWLEEGGLYSHILFVDYRKPGCFECLYTDTSGEKVNNRARKNTGLAVEKGMIRNGCGGTRAAYGTSILLKTTAALLDTLHEIDRNKLTKNTLIDITPTRVGASDIIFPMEACNCCGNNAE
jgi:molybdopterin/thiamine biosynthesis adenylyltransferase